MSSTKVYSKPPIAEAVIQFRLAATVLGCDLEERLTSVLGMTYSGEKQQQNLFQMVAAAIGDSVSTSARTSPHIVLLRSQDGLRLLGCGNSVLSVHVLCPYPGWSNFLAQAVEAIGALREDWKGQGLKALSIRYIDRIALPAVKGIRLSDYLKVGPPKLDSMPQQVAGFHIMSQMHDPTEGIMALLTVSSAPQDQSGSPVVLYDLSMHKTVDHDWSLCEGAWIPALEEMHQRQKDIFEESITDTARELFND